jgi:hypothetical protein
MACPNCKKLQRLWEEERNAADYLQSYIEPYHKAVTAAHEWAAKYPLQGKPTEADKAAAEHIYMVTDKLLKEEMAKNA